MEKGPDAYRSPGPLRPDPVLQTRAGGGMPGPILNFEGVSNVNSVQPADTTMAVGPDHVFQWVNLAFQVFDKAGNVARGALRRQHALHGSRGRLRGDQRRRHHRPLRPVRRPLDPDAARAGDLRGDRQPPVHRRLDERRSARLLLPLRLSLRRLPQRLSEVRNVARRLLHDRPRVRREGRLHDDRHGLRPDGHAERRSPSRRSSCRSTTARSTGCFRRTSTAPILRPGPSSTPTAPPRPLRSRSFWAWIPRASPGPRP